MSNKSNQYVLSYYYQHPDTRIGYWVYHVEEQQKSTKKWGEAKTFATLADAISHAEKVADNHGDTFYPVRIPEGNLENGMPEDHMHKEVNKYKFEFVQVGASILDTKSKLVAIGE